jgi:hypothetical protein
MEAPRRKGDGPSVLRVIPFGQPMAYEGQPPRADRGGKEGRSDAKCHTWWHRAGGTTREGSLGGHHPRHLPSLCPPLPHLLAVFFLLSLPALLGRHSRTRPTADITRSVYCSALLLLCLQRTKHSTNGTVTYMAGSGPAAQRKES